MVKILRQLCQLMLGYINLPIIYICHAADKHLENSCIYRHLPRYAKKRKEKKA